MNEKKYPKEGDRVRYRKDEGRVLAFYKNNDGTYSLNLEDKGCTSAWTHIPEADIQNIEVL